MDHHGASASRTVRVGGLALTTTTPIFAQPEQDSGSHAIATAEGPTIRVSAEGYWYSVNGQEFGPFTVQNESEPGFAEKLASKIGTTVEAVNKAREQAILRPMTLDDVADILSTTIRQDYATKLVLFLAGLLTFTKEDQVNILMAGEASGGKSYVALEIVSYFPSDVQMAVGTSSPSAFIHDAGKWDGERKLVQIDLRGKIILLLDQPHYSLLQRLRALLSHDVKEILFKITDRTKSGAHRTKNVLIMGFPTFVFCSAKMSLEEQELTRCFILSPETSQAKLDESLRLLAAKVGNREAFKQWVENHPQRRSLQDRVLALRRGLVQEVVIHDEMGIYQRFLSQHPRLAPRHQRDFPRILALIKGHALLNFAHRGKPEGNDRAIIATKEDEEAAFKLYGMIGESNELGLAPEVFEIYINVLKPLLKQQQLVTRQQILNAYYKHFGRFLNEQRLRREILPPLEAKGLITQEPDPTDRRRILVALSGVEDEIVATSVYRGPDAEGHESHINTISPSHTHIKPLYPVP